jgi:hypothetical protein
MSGQFNTLKKRWEQGRISEDMLRKYVEAGRITPEEFTEITGIEY